MNKTLTPEGWFKEGCVINRLNNNDVGIWIPYSYKGRFFMIACHFSVRLGVDAIRVGFAKTAQQLSCFYLS